MSILAKLGRAAAKKLDEMQGIDSKTPGRTSEDRGVVVGKDRTKAYKNTEQIKGGLKAGAGAAGLGILSAGTGETDTLSDSKKEKISYSISDLPKEGSATYESEGKTIYTNSKFKKAAQDAEGETFKYKGKTYNVEAVLEALQRLSKAEGGDVDPKLESFRQELISRVQMPSIAPTANEEQIIKEQVAAIKNMSYERLQDIKTEEEQRKMDAEMRKAAQRVNKQEGGSMLMPPEMPVDTYTPEEQANAEATQLSDSEMEDRYMDFMLDESLGEEEQDYLMNALESDPKLSEIFDKVITTASEFSGAGEVEGPGTGVSDSIPARLSDGEFVITRKATDELGADNLQKMMDQAEREADSEGGMLRKAIGGLLEDPMQSEKDMGQRDVTDEEINKSMLSANRMPSLQPSRLR